VLLQSFVQPLGDLASKGAEQVGSAEFLRQFDPSDLLTKRL
jgi:hypothetical protein